MKVSGFPVFIASASVSIQRCVCPEGFEGDKCEINIDDCEDNDCENNSTCVDGVNNYTCMCSPEYTGTLPQTSLQPHTFTHPEQACVCVPVGGRRRLLEATLESQPLGETADESSKPLGGATLLLVVCFWTVLFISDC